AGDPRPFGRPRGLKISPLPCNESRQMLLFPVDARLFGILHWPSVSLGVPTMAEPNTCPECGATLPDDAPRRLCPHCLMQQAVAGPAPEAPAPPSRRAAVSLTLEPASSSVLARIAETIGQVPHILLRDTEIETGPGPIIKPSSPEMPAPTERPDK